MKSAVVILYIFLLLSCQENQLVEHNTKTLDFGAFTIETPAAWKKVERQGIDSYVGEIAIDEKDTLSFDLGWYSNKLYERGPMILDSSFIGKVDTILYDPSAFIYVKNSLLVDPDKYRKNNVSWDTIDNRKAKIVYPRRTGIGTTGIYIDSLWPSGFDIDHFNLYGENLKPENEKLFLAAIKTLKFHKKQ
jgi:hypothetical protein